MPERSKVPKERIQTHSIYFKRLTYYSSLDLKIEFYNQHNVSKW